MLHPLRSLKQKTGKQIEDAGTMYMYIVSCHCGITDCELFQI